MQTQKKHHWTSNKLNLIAWRQDYYKMMKRLGKTYVPIDLMYYSRLTKMQ